MEKAKKDFNLKLKLAQLIKNKVVILCFVSTLVYLASGYCKWIEIALPVIAFFAFIFLSAQNSLCLLAYLHFFALSNIGYYSCLMATLVCFVVVLLGKYVVGVYKHKYKIYKAPIAVMAAFLILTTIVSLFYNFYSGGLIIYCYLPLFYLIFAMRKEFEINEVMRYFLSGLIVSCACAAIANFLPYYQYKTIDLGRFRGFINCANYLYMRALIILTFYMNKYLANQISSLKFFLIYGITAVISLATISKTAICMIALLTVVFLIFFISQNFKKRIIYAFLFVVIVAATLLICKGFIAKVFNRFSLAFNSNDVMSKLTTGRWDIWAYYLAKWSENPITILFGYGIFGPKLFIPKLNKSFDTHSFFVMIIYRFGIVGIILLAAFVVLLILNLKKQKPKLYAYLPLFWFVLESFLDNTFQCNNIFMLVLACLILFSNCKPKLDKNLTNN